MEDKKIQGSNAIPPADRRAPRTQEERSREMRARLVEATLACLQEHGYHGCSLSMILGKAGASRGAWNHHFRSKKDLVAAAVKSLLDAAIEKSREEVASLRGPGDFGTALEFVWDTFYTGRYRDVWLEFNIACRTDSELRDRLHSVLEDFQNALDALWTEHLAGADGHADARGIMNLTVYMLRGMALQSASYDRPEHFQEQRKLWVQLLEQLVRIKPTTEGP